MAAARGRGVGITEPNGGPFTAWRDEPSLPGAPHPIASGSERLVVVLCGPPGAGKSTAARESGPAVYDRDDPAWSSEREFTAALRALRSDPLARAAVIRTAATASARAKASAMVGATHLFVLLADLPTLEARIRERGRGDKVRTLAALRGWFDAYEAGGVDEFPGWPAVLSGRPQLSTSEVW